MYYYTLGHSKQNIIHYPSDWLKPGYTPAVLSTCLLLEVVFYQKVLCGTQCLSEGTEVYLSVSYNSLMFY